MLRVTVELIPHGIGEPQVLGTGDIVNTGQGTFSRGEYVFNLRDKAGRSWEAGTVTDFPRKRLLAWDLLYRVLHNAIGDRNSA